MKKKVIRFISSVLVFVILLVGSFSLPVYAISMSCVNDHFESLITTGSEEDNNLVIRTPPSENTCPYVAMSLLLTFYDTYWNEAFVDDDYEWQIGTYNSSTDTLVETFAPVEEAEAWSDYVDGLGLAENEETYPYYPFYALRNIENYLEPELISIGYGLGYHNLDETKWGLTVDAIVSVLQSYLFANERFTIYQVEVKCCKESDGYDVETIMKDQISKGYPAIYFGTRYKTEAEMDESSEPIESQKVGHFLVAYGVDDSGDILLHTGWSESEFSSYNTTQYTMDRAVIWLEIDETYLPHAHSYHYKDSVTEELFCACQIYSGHPSHENNHIHINNYDSETHYQGCHCGERISTEEHSLTNLIYNISYHRESCTICPYIQLVSHEYIIPNLPVEGGHSLKCVCGEQSSLVEAHFSYRREYSITDTVNHSVYCQCGQFLRTEPHTLITRLGKTYCSGCGYVRLPGQIIMGKKEENLII